MLESPGMVSKNLPGEWFLEIYPDFYWRANGGGGGLLASQNSCTFLIRAGETSCNHL